MQETRIDSETIHHTFFWPLWQRPVSINQSTKPVPSDSANLLSELDRNCIEGEQARISSRLSALR